MGVSSAEHGEFYSAMCIHRTSVVAQVGIYHCKVEVHDKILVAVWRWVLAYIQVAIKSFELICCVDIIVVAEHRHGETLAESARADKEEVTVGVFYLLYKSSLIDIVIVVFANCHEVHHAVGNTQRFYCCILFFHTKLCHVVYYSSANIRYFFRIAANYYLFLIIKKNFNFIISVSTFQCFSCFSDL